MTHFGLFLRMNFFLGLLLEANHNFRVKVASRQLILANGTEKVLFLTHSMLIVQSLANKLQSTQVNPATSRLHVLVPLSGH